jgi:uncharacterized protein (DUF1330 family)
MNTEESVMNAKYKIMLAVVVGAALGGAAVQGLHAQAKPKAYSVTETQILDAAATAAYVPLVLAAIKTAGGHPFNTGGGTVVALVGDAPTRVAINEWDSLEQARAFYASAAFKDLTPQRDKAQKIIRLYVVEAVK